jgi:multidrug transporter EmrE-like cation transporter
MDKAVFLLILASVALSSLAQIVLKAGMSSDGVVQGLAGGLRWSAVASVAASPLVWAGLGVYFASAAVWLLVLARVEVSLAYPFVGLGFVLTMLLGWLVYGDAMTPVRIGGTLLIATGVAILARG